MSLADEDTNSIQTNNAAAVGVAGGVQAVGYGAGLINHRIGKREADAEPEADAFYGAGYAAAPVAAAGGYSSAPNCHAETRRVCNPRTVETPRQISNPVCVSVPREVCTPVAQQVPRTTCAEVPVAVETTVAHAAPVAVAAAPVAAVGYGAGISGAGIAGIGAGYGAGFGVGLY